MTCSVQLANRLGFAILGLTNNFAYVIMLSAAYDLLKESDTKVTTTTTSPSTNSSLPTTTTTAAAQPYCNAHSTSTILLADTLPSLGTKIIYPMLLVGLPTAYKAIATAVLSALAFIITGLNTNQVLIFTGVICASFSSGLGESTYLSNTPLYGDVSLSGWSMGTGAAGLFGAMAYAILRMLLPIKWIMIIMLVVPLSMMAAYFYVIVPISNEDEGNSIKVKRQQPVADGDITNLSTISTDVRRQQQQEQQFEDSNSVRNYGSGETTTNPSLEGQLINSSMNSTDCFDFRAKIRCLPALSKYFLPLLLVYFAEYFINQGLFEIIYYPEIKFLDHAAQYRWFQVSYQLGVMISRSSLDLLQIRNLWAMSLLQAANAVLFLAHASKLIYIPSFYIVIALIIYEGLLGGFTYVNTFFRVKKEVQLERQEFCISAVTTADSLGIVMAAMAALPVHQALCKLYE